MMRLAELAKVKSVWIALALIAAILSAGAAGREMVERPRENSGRIDGVERTLDSAVAKLDRITILAEIHLCKLVVEERGNDRTWQSQCLFPGQRARIVNEYMEP